jgi:hypothetical protein
MVAGGESPILPMAPRSHRRGRSLSLPVLVRRRRLQDERNVEVASRTNLAPDFTAKWEINQSWGHAQVSSPLRYLAVDDGPGHKSTTFGGGLVGANYNLVGRRYASGRKASSC